MGRENCWKNHYTFLNVENNAGWRQYAKSVLSQNNYIDSSKLANVVHAVLSSSSWKVLFIAAFDKIYGCEYCSSRQFVAIFQFGDASSDFWAVLSCIWHISPIFEELNLFMHPAASGHSIKYHHGCSPERCGIWEIQLRDALQSVSSLMRCKSQAHTATHILQAKLWGVAHSWKKNVWNGRAEPLQLCRFPCLEINLNLSI